MMQETLSLTAYCPSFTLRDESYISLENIVHETIVLRDLQTDIHVGNINIFDCKEAMRKSYELPRGPRYGMPRIEIVFVSHAETLAQILEDNNIQGREDPDMLQFNFVYNGPVASGVLEHSIPWATDFRYSISCTRRRYRRHRAEAQRNYPCIALCRNRE